MQTTYIAKVQHAQGQQFATIQARSSKEAERRLKALGCIVLTTPTEYEE